jgi:hypothetical protein
MNSKPLRRSRHRFRASRLPQTIKTSPFRRNLKGLWTKKANMSSVTILVTGKTTQNDV